MRSLALHSQASRRLSTCDWMFPVRRNHPFRLAGGAAGVENHRPTIEGNIRQICGSHTIAVMGMFGVARPSAGVVEQHDADPEAIAKRANAVAIERCSDDDCCLGVGQSVFPFLGGGRKTKGHRDSSRLPCPPHGCHKMMAGRNQQCDASFLQIASAVEQKLCNERRTIQ